MQDVVHGRRVTKKSRVVSYKNRKSRKQSAFVSIKNLVAMFSIMAMLVFNVSPLVSFANHDAGGPYEGVVLSSSDKVAICHGTGSGYSTPNPNMTSFFSGGHDSDLNDIIPPFHYDIGNGVQSFPGMNWEEPYITIWEHLDKNGKQDCAGTPPTDLCTNIDGIQTTIPNGYEDPNNDKVCTPITVIVDLCTNLPEVQTSVPNGYEDPDNDKVCTPVVVVVDLCTNLDGDQTSIPQGYEDPNNDKVCTPITVIVDLCTNLPEVQTSVPNGYEDPDNDKVCTEIVVVVDLCTNLIDDQAVIPDGYEDPNNDGVCTAIPDPNDVLGCTDHTAVNFDEDLNATVDDGSCIYTLTVIITDEEGDGEGVVASTEDEVDDIDCDSLYFDEVPETSGDCTEDYVAGSVVDIAVTPHEGSSFEGSWVTGSGTCTGTATSCQITMNSNITVTAHFSIPSTNGGGGGGGGSRSSGSRTTPTPTPTPPPGQILGETIEVPPQPQVQGATLPTTGTSAHLLMAIMLAGTMPLFRRLQKDLKSK